jgi:hypothetical protein
MRPIKLFRASILLLSVLIMARMASAQVNEIVVIDSTGKTLGQVIGTQGIRYTLPHVPFKIGTTTVVLAIFKNRFVGGGMPVDLYFNTPGCNDQTGQPAVDVRDIVPGESTIIPWSFVGANGGTVYIPTPNGQPIQSFNALSRFFDSGGGIVQCQEVNQVIATAIPATSLINMFSLYTPPFAVTTIEERGGRKK